MSFWDLLTIVVIPGSRWPWLFGIALLVLPVLALVGLAVHSRRQRHIDAGGRPPAIFDRAGVRDRSRKPSLLALAGGVYHGRPVEDPDETHVLTVPPAYGGQQLERQPLPPYRGRRRYR